MTKPLTAAQMRALEHAAISSGAVTGRTLMERAGKGVVESIFEVWPKMATGAHRAAVLCGPGNNGGDGYVVAHLLAERGWNVETFSICSPASMPADARIFFETWRKRGVTHPLTLKAVTAFKDPDLWIDAIFGIGLNRRVEGETAYLLRYLAGSGGDRQRFETKLLAVDIPSGLCSDTGALPGVAEPASAPPCPFCTATVTFHAPKFGHLTHNGPKHCGTLIVKDIGL